MVDQPKNPISTATAPITHNALPNGLFQNKSLIKPKANAPYKNASIRTSIPNITPPLCYILKPLKNINIPHL